MRDVLGCAGSSEFLEQRRVQIQVRPEVDQRRRKRSVRETNIQGHAKRMHPWAGIESDANPCSWILIASSIQVKSRKKIFEGILPCVH
jgi:hypothetical protein